MEITSHSALIYGEAFHARCLPSGNNVGIWNKCSHIPIVKFTRNHRLLYERVYPSNPEINVPLCCMELRSTPTLCKAACKNAINSQAMFVLRRLRKTGSRQKCPNIFLLYPNSLMYRRVQIVHNCVMYPYTCCTRKCPNISFFFYCTLTHVPHR